MTFGTATLVDGAYVYIYGTEDVIKTNSRERYLIVRRVPTREVTDFSAWRYYDHGQWVADLKIQVRTSATPWGEWSAPTTVYQCPGHRAGTRRCQPILAAIHPRAPGARPAMA